MFCNPLGRFLGTSFLHQSVRRLFLKKDIDGVRNLNTLINTAETHEELLEIYRDKGNAFDGINYCTMLKKLLTNRPRESRGSVDTLIGQCAKSLKDSLAALNNFTLVQLVVLTRRNRLQGFEDATFQEEVRRRNGTFLAKELNMLMKELPGCWSRQSIIGNLKRIGLEGLEQEDLLNLLSNLNRHSYPDLNSDLTRHILLSKLKLQQLNFLLETVLVHRISFSASSIVDEIVSRKSHTLSDIAIFMDCLADNKFVSLKGIQHSKDAIISMTGVTESTLPEDTQSKLILACTARDCTQLLAAFVRLDAIDGQTFDILEANFINNIERSEVETLLNYLKGHSKVCQRLMHHIALESDSQTRPSELSSRLARVKKYHEGFVNRVLTWVAVEEAFTPQEVVRMLRILSSPRLTLRATRRLVVWVCEQKLGGRSPESESERELAAYIQEYSKGVPGKQ